MSLAQTPARAKRPFWPSLFQNIAVHWGEGCYGQGKGLAIRHKFGSDPEQVRNSHYLHLYSSTPEIIWISHCNWTVTGGTLTHVKCLHQPCLLCRAATNQGKGCSRRGESSAVRDKGGSELECLLSKAGEATTVAYTGSAAEVDQITD